MDWREARIGADILPGWVPLVDRLHAKLLEIDPDIVVDQVKEKFGGLRYYWHSPTKWEGDWHEDARRILVDAAEEQSYFICEICGEDGETTDGGRGWLHTLCPRHTEEYENGKRPYEMVE